MTVTVALEQTGWATAAGDWTDIAVGTPIPMNGFLLTTVGLVFSVQTVFPFSLAGDRALDPPLWSGGGAFTLTLIGPFGGTFGIWLRKDPGAPLWSDAAPPVVGASDELLTTVTLVPIAPDDTATVTFTTELDATLRAQVVGRSTWNGRIALIIVPATNGASDLTVTSITGASLAPFFGGMAGGATAPRTRFVRDYRYGMPALNTALVRDGDNPGLWVRPFDADPEDPPATYRPRPGEGSVDDGIGDL